MEFEKDEECEVDFNICIISKITINRECIYLLKLCLF